MRGTTSASVGRALHRGLQGATPSICPYVRPGYRHVFHLYVVETKNPRSATRCRFPGQERHRRKDALLDRHPSAGRVSLGQRRAGRRIVANASGTRPVASVCRCIPELTAGEVDYVVAKVLEWDKSRSDDAIPGRRRRHGEARRSPCHRLCRQQTFRTRRGLQPAIKSGSMPLSPSSAPSRASRRCEHVWLDEVKPDVFCFCTPPDVRLPLIQMGIASGAKLIAFEKPVAMTSAEGMAIKDALEAARRQSGGQPPASLRRSLQKGAGDHRQRRNRRRSHRLRHRHWLGRSHVEPPCRYTSWFNNYEPAEWVMGQAAGRGKLSDSHASPDYVAGVVHFRNGVRGVYDCGAGAPDVPGGAYWWRKCRIGAIGTDVSPKCTPAADGGPSRRTASNQDPAAWTTTTTWRPTSTRWPIGSTTTASRIRCDSSRAYSGMEIVSGPYSIGH